MNGHLIHDKGNNTMGERTVFSINDSGLIGYVKNTYIYIHLVVYHYSKEKAMAPHSSTLAWKNPMDEGAW